MQCFVDPWVGYAFDWIRNMSIRLGRVILFETVSTIRRGVSYLRHKYIQSARRIILSHRSITT